MTQKAKLKITENLPKLENTLFDEAQIYITNLLDCDSFKRFVEF